MRHNQVSMHGSRLGWVRGFMFAIMAGLLALQAGIAQADSPSSNSAVPVDRQDYVTGATTTNPLDGSTVDPYNNDPSSIHVAINGGQQFARSFVHLALNYVPSGAAVTDAAMTVYVTQQADAMNTSPYELYNQNTSAAIVQACVLTTALAANFDPSNPPPYDCSLASAVGKPNSTFDTWTFSLKDLVAYWNAHGNTGAALIPVGSGDASQTWAVAFNKGHSTAKATYTETVGNDAGQGTTLAGGSTYTQPAPVPAAGPFGAGASQPYSAPGSSTAGSAATAAPAAPARRPSLQPAPPHSASSFLWLWVAIGLLAFAAAAVAIGHQGTVMGWARRLLPRTTTELRAHPRSYTLASAALAWAFVFSAYSVVNLPAANGSASAAQASGAPSGNAGSTQALPTVGPSLLPGVAIGGGGTSSAAPAAAGFGSEIASAGPGTYRTINGIKVFFPSNGSPPIADLYQGGDDTIGIDDHTINYCTHASLTYGAALHISATDLPVYWQMINDQGGIYGRKVSATYQNDNYDPGTAVQAAEKCKDTPSFIVSGGLCLDCVPPVRQWAEQNHVPYYYNIGTIEGSDSLRYSYTAWPTLEQMGTWFGQLAVAQFKGKKVGIIYRQSSNWQPAVDIFQKIVEQNGMKVVGRYGTTINQGNYNSEITQLHTAGADVVYAWENALAELEMIKQAQGQQFFPAWFVNPFNIMTQTLGNSASLQQPIWGVGAGWYPYDPGYYGGPYASYASDIHQFEAAYKQYDPGAQLTGPGGDLLYLTWQGERAVAQLFRDCGPNCSRNRIIGMLLGGYHPQVQPYCDVNFARDPGHHFGAYLFSPLKVYQDPNGQAAIEATQLCIPDTGPGS